MSSLYMKELVSHNEIGSTNIVDVFIIMIYYFAITIDSTFQTTSVVCSELQTINLISFLVRLIYNFASVKNEFSCRFHLKLLHLPKIYPYLYLNHDIPMKFFEDLFFYFFVSNPAFCFVSGHFIN